MILSSYLWTCVLSYVSAIDLSKMTGIVPLTDQRVRASCQVTVSQLQASDYDLALLPTDESMLRIICQLLYQIARLMNPDRYQKSNKTGKKYCLKPVRQRPTLQRLTCHASTPEGRAHVLQYNRVAEWYNSIDFTRFFETITLPQEMDQLPFERLVRSVIDAINPGQHQFMQDECRIRGNDIDFFFGYQNDCRTVWFKVDLTTGRMRIENSDWVEGRSPIVIQGVKVELGNLGSANIYIGSQDDHEPYGVGTAYNFSLRANPRIIHGNWRWGRWERVKAFSTVVHDDGETTRYPHPRKI